MTLDIVAMLFDDLFDDPKIPISVKGLAGRLQTPMLKLVIADKSFFSRKSHPARQMLDKLGELSRSLPATIKESDPIYAKLESIIQSFVEEFRDGINTFDGLRKQFDALVVNVNEGAKQETQGVTSQINQEEKLALAKTAAQAEITARLRAGTAPKLIVEFLTQHWVRLLVVTHFKASEESQAWKNTLKTLDVLLWSVEPKETLEERRKMIAVLPNLIKILSDGLAYAGIDDAIRAQLLSDLRKLHSVILGQSAQPSTEARHMESVIEDGPEESATITEPDRTEPDGAEPETGEEMQLDFRPGKHKSAAISEPANTETMETALPGEQSPTTDLLSASLGREPGPEPTESTALKYEEPSAQLRAELDQVVDATRTMFSDIDRFIMLGQSTEAIGVLESRITHEPSDRDSWIKLMAIYRDEDMKDDFYRTYAIFSEQFGENSGS